MSENKKYKFSEIIAMLEDGKVEKGTVFERENGVAGIKKLEVAASSNGKLGLQGLEETLQIRSNINVIDINSLWSMRGNEVYYLVAPDCFGLNEVLNYDMKVNEYFLSGIEENEEVKTQFTQKEIDKMTFNIEIFDPIKVEDFKLK